MLLLTFCRRVQELYGENAVTPNMHLHCHLRECVLDFGPIYSFWLFSFKRYNGILGDFPNNKKSIEIQLMRHFEKDQNLLNMPLPSRFSNEFSPLLCNSHYNMSTDNEGKLDKEFIVSARRLLPSLIAWPTNTISFCTFPNLSATKMLSSDERERLLSIYRNMYPTLEVTSDYIPYSITTFNSCFLGSEKLGCGHSYRTRKYSYILASHVSLTPVDYLPGQIQCIFTHRFHLKDQEYTNAFCEVSWYREHELRYQYGKSLQIFHRDFERKTFLPLPRIFSKFAPAFGNLHKADDHVLFICPISRRIVM